MAYHHISRYPSPTDAVSLTLQYCQDRFPVQIYHYGEAQAHEEDEEYELDLDDLPWDYLPGIQQLRVPPRERNDLCDGHLISDKILLEATEVLRTFVDHCRVAGVDLDVYDGFTFETLPEFTKTCLVLEILGQRHCLPIFMARDHNDSTYPLPDAEIAEALGDEPGSVPVFQFMVEQSRFDPRPMQKGEHVKFARHEVLPFKSIRLLGHGAQGTVDAVEEVPTKVRLARKTWRSPNLQSNKRFFKEISLLKRLDTRRHIIEVINTYSRGTQVGIVMTLADCDLAHVLSLPKEERRATIPDDNLRKAYGCLSFSLSHMHEMGIRHKDIKPQNVLVRSGTLLFTDFGTSKDYSELSNSLTVGGTNTRKYASPEFTGDVNRQAPADVFALGLVLLSIWSVLEGWQADAPENFASIASSSPFCDNMAAMESWISDRLAGKVQPHDASRNLYQRKWDLIILKVLSKMIPTQPEKRLRINEAVAIFRHLSTEASFCTSCQVLVEDENHDTVNADWILNFIDLTTESAAQLEDTNVPKVDGMEGSTDRDVKSVVIVHELGQEDENGNEDEHEARGAKIENQPDKKSDDQHIEQNEQRAVELDTESSSASKLQSQGMVLPPLESTLTDPLVNESNSSNPKQINFVDCFQRTFACPFHSIKSWKGMSAFIKKKFPTNVPQIVHISAQIHAGQYDLIRDNGIVIDEDFWEEIIQPGWTVHLKLWPLEAMSGGGPELNGMQSQLPEEKDALNAADTTIPPRQIQLDKHVEPEVQIEEPPMIGNDSPRTEEPLNSNMPENSDRATTSEPDTAAATETMEEDDEEGEDELVTCPVCMIFQGEKQAVNYHVNFTHYPPETEDDEELESEEETEVEVEVEVEVETPPAATEAQNASPAAADDQGNAGSAATNSRRRQTTSRTKSKPSGFVRWMIGSTTGSSSSGSKKRQGSGSRRTTS